MFQKFGYHKSPLGFKTKDWFVDEIIKLENKMTFASRILRKISK